MYESKRTAEGGLKLIFKLFLNCLYGKMGQRREYITSFLTKDKKLADRIENLYTDVKVEPLGDG
jgi:hypothetical protein